MGIGDLSIRSNIFGVTTSGSSSPDIPFSSSETTQAGQLIDKIKNVADNEIAKLAAAVDWLGRVANAGQNSGGGVKSFVGYENTLPDPLDSSNVFKGWTAPALPSIPTFPVLPSDLKIDMTPFKSDVKALIDDMKSSWMYTFLPSSTDTTQYTKLFDNILSGADTSSVKSTLDGIFNDLTAALNQYKDAALADVNSQISDLKSNLSNNITAIQPKIDASIVQAQSTSAIIFARARDQAAREGARLEAEALSELASRGWSMPNGVLMAAQDMARQGTLDAASKIAAEEAARVQGMNIDFAKAAIDAWIQTTDFTMRSNIEGMRAVLEARFRHSAFLLDAQKAKADEAVRALGLRLDFSKFAGDLAVKYRLGVIDSMNGLVNAWANLTRNEMEYHAQIANAQREALRALIDYYRLSLSESELGISVSKANIDTKLRWAEIAGSFIGTAVSNHVQAAMGAGNMYGRIAAAALGGLNAVASTAVSK